MSVSRNCSLLELFSISSCRTRVKSTSCRRVLSSSFIAIAVGSGIILDNFTASRGDSETRRPMEGPQVELAPMTVVKAFLLWSCMNRLWYLWYHGFSMRHTILIKWYFSLHKLHFFFPNNLMRVNFLCYFCHFYVRKLAIILRNLWWVLIILKYSGYTYRTFSLLIPDAI